MQKTSLTPIHASSAKLQAGGRTSTKPPVLLIPFSGNWIVYEDDDLLVVNKPAGLLSVPGREADPLANLVAQIQTKVPEALIVHRLDMDTSGLMVLAKNPETHRFSRLHLHAFRLGFQHPSTQQQMDFEQIADFW
ncbi:MAG: hypothetical protein IE914_09505 [Thiotrichales bacterium]|nr:hypothetical protein [Thiotrichales bacterium]